MRLIWAILFPPLQVRLDPGADILFPDRCPRCASPEPDSTLALRAARPGPLRALAGIGHAGGYLWLVPCCAPCARTTRRRSALSHAAGFAWFLACVFIALAITSPLGRPLSTLAALPVLIVLVLPACFWPDIFPAPVAVHIEKGDAIFTLKDADYARDFRAINAVVGAEPTEHSP